MTERQATLSVALAAIAAGAVVGATARYGISLALPEAVPVGTLVANVLGAFLLGAVSADRRVRGRLDERAQLLVGTGFCSSFTTYSTFAAETVDLTPTLAAANVAATYALGIAAVLLGQFVVRGER